VSASTPGSVPAPSAAGASVTAPPAPGSLGKPVEAEAARAYLDALGGWRDDRRRELDQLDTAALGAADGPSLTGDIALSLALWKAASDRYDLLLAAWDGGRVGTTERERLASLIWGRLDATLDRSLLAHGGAGTGLAVSLPEACRLSDALASQLRVRLGLDAPGLAVAARLRQLRAQIERIRDQVAMEPVVRRADAERRRDELAARVDRIVDKAGRGGDVGGLLGPLEADAATYERDLIIGAARRREAMARVTEARIRRTDLEAREAALRTLVEQCVATVDPAPRYAVPDVAALGPVPNTPGPLEAYLRRLEQVGRAMTVAQDAYARAVLEREELASRLEAYAEKARATGHGEDAEVGRAYRLAREELDRRPARIAIATQLLGLYQTYLEAAGRRAVPAIDRATASPRESR
jgi:hypothetical protein